MKELLNDIRKAHVEQGEGTVTWRSPSNIALIKYWGKRGKQIPANASLSFSLTDCHTTSSISYIPRKESDKIAIKFSFEGKPNLQFSARIERFLETIKDLLPFISMHELIVESENSFPHSSGIASSASAMSSFALGLVEIQNNLMKKPLGRDDTYKLASYIARLGSGSACRSVYGEFVVWGESKHIKGSSDLYAIPYPHKINPIFLQLHDDILIVDKEKKEISSSIGHGLMLDHPFAPRRYNIASKRIGNLRTILKHGDMDGFGRIIEQEALMLHALMMTSDPQFILFKPKTIAIIKEVWQWRKETNTHLYFSLDAGANVHLIYPSEDEADVRSFIKDKLLVYCENEQYLCDKIGKGPQRLTS